jgi:hypothetical protein
MAATNILLLIIVNSVLSIDTADELHSDPEFDETLEVVVSSSAFHSDSVLARAVKQVCTY